MEMFLAGFALGCLLCDVVISVAQIRECADCAVGSIERKWWRKAVLLAEFRKRESQAVRGKE